MKLMPASRAFATIRDEVASSVGPPNIMVPRQIGEIFRPLRPSWRYCMWSSLFGSSLRANGSRECAPDDRLREAIHRAAKQVWIASSLLLLAMTRGDGAPSLVPQYLKHA